MFTSFTPRDYQLSIFKTCISNNTLVVLPTGLGKTAIAGMTAYRRLLSYPSSKVVFLAPTKPLVEQHASFFREVLPFPEQDIAVFTGSIAPSKRHEMWKRSRVIISTPQAIENDVLGGKISLKDVSLMVVDEAHRAIGQYAYVFLAEQYMKTALHPRLIALTASPGTDKETIEQVCSNLSIERIEYRKSTSSDVVNHTNKTKVSWEKVDLPPELLRVRNFLSEANVQRLSQVKENGYLSKSPSYYSKTSLLKLQHELHAKITQGDRSVELMSSVSKVAQSLKLMHAMMLCETQTVFALHRYFRSILSDAKSGKSKAVKHLSIDPVFLSAVSIVRDLVDKKQEHPKLFLLESKLSAFLKRNPSAKVIIFTQFRDTAQVIKERLSFTSAELFFGQAKKDGIGFSQKKQKEVLDRFRNSEFQVLLATSVAEEGLDIPSVDHVFFFEPIPSAIRSVQRRGRTGRHSAGFVTVLMTKGTRDEAFRWVAFHKEKRMYSVLDSLQTTVKSDTGTKPQQKLNQYASSDVNKPTNGSSRNSTVRIVSDFREKGSPVLKALMNRDDVALELRQLQVGDFVLSKYSCVEFKHVSDFADSMVDNRLLTQLSSLVQYPRPILIIEGSSEEFSSRNIDPNAVNGMLATIALSYRIPILRTFSPFETANILVSLASREQDESDATFSFHPSKPLDPKTLLEFIVSSLPDVGPVLARSLLERFDSVAAISSASIDDLQSISLIGEKKAKRIYSALHSSYIDASKE